MVWVKRKKIKPGNGWWDEKKKREVIQTYILTGNLRLSAATNNVPDMTARKWKVTAWWKEQEDELRRGSKLQLSAKLTDLVNKAMLTLSDRIENGDFMWNRLSGEWVRKPISAEHSNKIVTQLIDRTLAVEKAAAPEKVTDEGLNDRLLKLRSEMISFAKQQKPIQVIEASFKELKNELVLESNNEASRETGLGNSGSNSSGTSPGSTSDNRPSDPLSTPDDDSSDSPGPSTDHGSTTPTAPYGDGHDINPLDFVRPNA